MTQKEKVRWLHALWEALNSYHDPKLISCWDDWNDVEDFFLPWIRTMEENFYE